jgi:hypothetical protein
MSAENRKARRRQVGQYARIFFQDKPMSAFCTMLDVSATGAQLRLNDTTEMPDEFTLVLSRDGNVRRQCRMMWRREDRIGVRFLKPPAAR